jgi:hypothetical protein
MKILKFLNEPVCVYDDYIDDVNLIEGLKKESLIDKTIVGQDSFSENQQKLYEIVNATFINYCAENDIDFNSLNFSNLQKGRLKKYDEKMVYNHLYEPHHDMVERSYITAIYYIDSSFNNVDWIGGELTIYKNLTFAEYPSNTINVLPKQNRLIIFPGFLVHRVKPYFGEKPRTTLVFGWNVETPTDKELKWI